MFRRSSNPDRLFDRRWRAFRPRPGRVRRIFAAVLLVLLSTIIFGYQYLTNAERVRAMAEEHLSELVGGQVRVGSASMSIFEGLRLDDVRVLAHEEDAASGAAPADAVLFSARTFIVQCDLRALVRGRLRATQIIAEKPHVHLTQDAESGSWNFHRLRRKEPRPQPATPTPSAPKKKPDPMPEVLLRNARVEISELRDGRRVSLGHISLDGQLTQDPDDRFGFVLQSRGSGEAVGALVRGSIDLSDGHVVAQLHNCDFRRDVWPVLPPEARLWPTRHQLVGRVDIPVLEYHPPTRSRPERFVIEMMLNGVELAVPPEEWMSGVERRRRRTTADALGDMRELYAAGGFSQPGAERAADDEGSAPLPGSPVALSRDATLPLSAVFGGEPPLAFIDGLASDAAPPPLGTPIDTAASLLQTTPIRLRQAAGKFIFTQDGIEIREVGGRVEGNAVEVSGSISGYRPDAPASLTIQTPKSEDLIIPAAPRYVWSLPSDLRGLYQDFKPEGACRVKLHASRTVAGEPVQVGGTIDLVDMRVRFRDFQYPLRQMTGRLVIGRDPHNGMDWLSLSGIRAKGVPGSINENSTISVDGWIGPLGRSGMPSGGHVRVRSDDIATDEHLVRAFDRGVRAALADLDADGTTGYPRVRGAVACDITRPIGRGYEWRVDADIHLREGSAKVNGFRYPLPNLRGEVRVRDGYADLSGLTSTNGQATVRIDGRAGWAPPDPRRHGGQAVAATAPDTDLKIAATGIPIDADLVAALPKGQREWIGEVDLRGRLDVAGRLHSDNSKLTARSGGAPAPQTILHELDLTLRDGSIKPGDGGMHVEGITAKVKLTPERAVVTDLRGKRGGAELHGDAVLTFNDTAHPDLALRAAAKNVMLETTLYDLLPAAARETWDELRPEGSVDAELTYSGPLGGAPSTVAANREKPITIDLTRAANDPREVGRSSPTTRPSTLPSDPAVATLADLPAGLHATLRPRSLAATVRSVPYRAEQIGGWVTIAPGKVVLHEITGRHGDATLQVSGTGTLDDRPQWDLKLTAANLKVDNDLRNAVPGPVAEVINALKLEGVIGLSLDRLTLRPGGRVQGSGVRVQERNAAAASAPNPEPRTPNSATAEVDLAGTITLDGASLDVGVPLAEVKGSVMLAAMVRNERLDALAGSIDVASLKLEDRPVQMFQAELLKESGKPEIHVAKMRATVAEGDLAGGLTLTPQDVGPTSYKLSLVLRNADVKELAREADPNLAGRLTASLALEGTSGHPLRRGRGDVVVNGKEMYRIPLVLGMLQVTNLGLPINTPFNTATARYSVDGEKVTFERIELRSNNMLMTGDGSLDFGTKKVSMTFVTDNPGGFKVPFLQDLWRGAQQELLRIHVKGTVQAPRVEAGMFRTITTTVDEVFKGDPPKEPKRSGR